MSIVQNLEWINKNSIRNYPIREGLSRADTSNSFFIPNELIVDAVFSVDDTSKSFFIQEIRIFEENVIIRIHDQNDVFVGSINIDVQTHSEGDFYPVVGKGEYKFIQGKLVIGDLSLVTQSVVGRFSFTISSTELEPTVLVPSLRGVSSIAVFNDNTLLVGDVKLKPGFNARIRAVESENTIFIDAVSGEGLGRVCLCEEVDDRPCIKTINGNGPDSSGNYDLRGVGCIEISDQEAASTVANTCEDVCCDCDDVNALITLLNDKQDQIDALSDRVTALGG